MRDVRDDVTTPTPGQTPELKNVAAEAGRHVAYLVVGTVMFFVFLFYANAMLGLIFAHAAWVLVVAFIGWPFILTMHAVGRWVVHNLHS